MIDEFILNALIAGVLVAVTAAPLGCFMVWRKMAYFGDTVSHSALMGVALGIAFDTENPIVMIGTCSAIALFLQFLQRDRRFSSDTLLGILAHSALSIGIILISMMDNFRTDMMYYLVGDILAISEENIYTIAGVGVFSAICLKFIWRDLLSLTVHEDLAHTEGVKVERIKITYMLLIAFLVAVALKVIGVLLITALMIIPAAAARTISKTPLQMILFSAIGGVVAVVSGIMASSQWDVPTGPAIVLSATVLFLLGRFKRAAI
ncbi:iron chelate uptake ABC transporter family permease subunit [Pseudemcibacter aquimaris]|uniref:iron chelate uptake ABC transporter family permease subunit n=1 Tax=Pseudemcibacter aquimaris TaxID=2857064 RepID=UPI002011C62A|nr:iron chelate uptake ABC transporter family permease subunit [Pseudemcibacter aquimaris]MCC3860578.1 metal ABC transporter permease [Pseudemcibacter aquimaris]WDU59400.1 metal ABC transporter permease [Pseudemcibacter aquimaris]